MFIALFDRITRASVRYYPVTLIAALIVSILGILAVRDLNLELLPRIEFPQTIVVVQWPEAESTEQFIAEITQPLEEALAGVEGVVNVESTTSSQFTFIIARSEFGLDQDTLLADLEQATNSVTLPEEVEPPSILNFSLSDLPVVIASVSSPELTLPELKALVESDLQPQLEAVDGVSQVTVSGGQELPADLAAAAGDLEETEEAEPEAVASATPEPTATVEPEPTVEIVADPARLPEAVIQQMAAFGMPLESATDISPEIMQQFAAFGDAALQFWQALTPDNLRSLPPESIALLPPAFLDTLDASMRAELDELAADFGGAGGALAATEEGTPASDESETTTTDIPEVEPLPLPGSWIAAAAAAGQTVSTTADITAEGVQGLIGFAPQLLQDLTPEMWRVLDPAVIEIALPTAADSLDETLVSQLQAIVNAASGTPPEPIALPEALVAAGVAAGFPLTTTADLSPDVIGALSAAAPELLATLTPETILALSPEQQAALPADYVVTLDEGLQDTLAVIVVRHAAFLVAQIAEDDTAEEAEATSTPEPEEPEPDPARLPDVVIQGSAAFGQRLETAQDLTPDIIRLLAGVPQAAQFLELLTDDNLRLMPAESIALLPPEFVAGLDPDLRAELDELAVEFGGAGALAQQEAEEAEAASAEAPPLSGPWIEPGPDGSEPLFSTAADLLFNSFGLSAAELINFLPESPQVENSADFIAALTPEALGYLAENEEGFVENLSPAILELMSPESLTFLLDSYPDAFTEELAERLRLVAAGEVEVFVPEASITRTDGDPSVILSIYKDGDANTVVVAHGVFDVMDAFVAAQADEGVGMNVSLVFEQATFIEDSIEGVSREGILGAIFAILVVLVFLSGRNRDSKYRPAWRSTLVVAVSIPLSVLAALALMRWVPPTLGVWLHDLANSVDSGILDFFVRLFPESVTLNIMTLSGLTVAVGRVVDDSIVVLENIYRFVQQGDEPKKAVTEGTKEVAIAIFSSTATTVAVFLPLGLIGGLIGSFFLPFGLTVTYALAASFIVAITVVPALAFLLIRKEHLPVESETWMQRVYTPTLAWALKHRAATMLLALLLFATSLFLLNLLPTSFIPELGEPTVNITITLPNGTGMVETNDAVSAFEEELSVLDGIETVQVEIGGAGGFAGLFGGGGVSQNQANLTITPAEIDEVDELTREIRALAIAAFGEENVTVSAASQTGFGGFSLIITNDSLEELIAAAEGIRQTLGEVDIDGDGMPDITNITSNIDAAAVGGNGTIIRIDGRSAVSFSGELETENTLGVTNAAKDAVAAFEGLPPGSEVTEGFESEQQVQGFRSMIVAIGWSILLVYAILALTFRSLIHPFTILFSLPFALVGASLALFVTNSVLGISAMIGLMMLVGIVVTNAIVLMELLLQIRRSGVGVNEALIKAGRTRLRPIWMTALAAVLALIPLAASRESGAVIASELARVVIGGLLVSTALTLVVVPVVYSLLEQLRSRIRRS